MNLTDLAAARRIPLIGRHEILLEIERRVKRGGTHLLYFEGEGGIGKTALLEAVLRLGKERAETGSIFARSVARQIVDLYHVDTHSPEGLIRRVIHVLGDEGFAQTIQVREEIDRARGVGNVDLAAERVGLLQKTFLAEFEGLAHEGVLLAFDTLEVLEYEQAGLETEQGLEVARLSTREWLFSTFLCSLKSHVVLLIAGRPGDSGALLAETARQNPFLQFRHVQLEALNLDETRDYLQTIARVEEEQGDADAADRLSSFADERAEIVHVLTAGRPILLALVSDLVAHGWLLPPPFGRSVQELQQQGAGAWWPEIEWALVVRIQESPTPVGDVIRALAWLRMGATPDLLARIMGLTTPDGKWDYDAVEETLAQVTGLTLVKVRPDEGRVFLHDEMYTLLERYVLSQASHEERERVYEAILDYYQDQAEDLRQQIEQVTGLAPGFYARLRRTYVEELHYRLRYRPSLGFAYYFWRAEEALGGLDTELDLMLRAELLRTVKLLQETGTLGELSREELEVDAAVRWGIRSLFFLNDPQGALSLFERVRERWARNAEELGLAWVHLKLYRAVARILRGEERDWREARDLLLEVERECDQALAGPPDAAGTRGFLAWLRSPRAPVEAEAREGQRWRARILKALALNYQGYLDRQQGQYKEAVRHYQASAMLQRRLGMAGLAAVLINLSYAMALIGECHHARLLAEEAERCARRHGQDYTLAVALNVRALVEEYDGHHSVALRFTDNALTIVRGLRAARVRGLIYLTRVRVCRHLIEPGAVYGTGEELFVDQALKEANQAVNLLKNNPPDRVTALIERGCLHREIARRHYEAGDQVAALQAARSAERNLERTVTLAGAMDLSDQQALAWTSLAWLWYYAGHNDEADNALREAARCVPPEYCFPALAQAPGPRRQEARLPFWTTLGEGEMLRANIALDEFLHSDDEEEKSDRLKEAVNHITLGLTYYAQVANQYYELTRAEERLHKRMVQDRPNIGLLHRFARKVATEQGIQQPTRFQEFLDRMFGPADLWTQ